MEFGKAELDKIYEEASWSSPEAQDFWHHVCNKNWLRVRKALKEITSDDLAGAAVDFLKKQAKEIYKIIGFEPVTKAQVEAESLDARTYLNSKTHIVYLMRFNQDVFTSTVYKDTFTAMDFSKITSLVIASKPDLKIEKADQIFRIIFANQKS